MRQHEAGLTLVELIVTVAILAIVASAGLVIFAVLAVFKGPAGAWNLFKSGWQAWKDLAHKIGNFQARVILSIFYAILVAPFGLAARFSWAWFVQLRSCLAPVLLFKREDHTAISV